MSGNSGDLGNILAQAQKMQKASRRPASCATRASTARPRRRRERHRQRDGGRGGQAAEEAAKGGDAGMLQDLAVAALKDAQARAKRSHDERMAGVTGGMNLPGLF